MLLRICIVTLFLLGIVPPAYAAQTLAEVRTLPELRAQQKITVRDTWEIQCGWSESGENGGPWLLVHLYAKYVGKKELPKEPRHLKDTAGVLLGPVTLQCRFDDEKQATDRSVMVLPALPAENLFCASVLTARKGKYTLEICEGDSVLASAIVDIKEPRVNYWHSFDKLSRQGEAFVYQASAKAYSVTANFSGSMPRLPEKAAFKLIDPPKNDRRVLLPLAIPSLPEEWMQLWTDVARKVADKDQAGRGLALKLEKENFEVEAVEKMDDWADWHLAARWWVNGKAIVPPLGEHFGRMEARKTDTTKTVSVAFGYPEGLGAKAGDEISLQLVYLPDEFVPLTKDGLRQLVGFGSESGAVRVPMLSNVFKFKLTQELIALREKHRVASEAR